MKKLAYSSAFDPPAPVLTLRITPPGEAVGTALVAIVDTGADMTLIPEGLATTLNLPAISRVGVSGITSSAEVANVHAANVDIVGTSVLAELVAYGAEAVVGRDLLNRFVVELNGPFQTLAIRGGSSRHRKGSKKRPRKA